jgi:hypothetical protein
MRKPIQEMPLCSFVSTTGIPCRGIRIKDSAFCRWHAPKKQSEAAKKEDYESRLREVMAELAAGPNSVEALITATIKHVNLAIEMGCEHYSENPKEMAGFLKLMETRLKLIKLQQQITDADRYGPEQVKADIRTIVTAIRKYCSEEQIKNIREDLVRMLNVDSPKDLFDTGHKSE